VQSSSRTELARGTLNNHDQLTVELVTPPDTPPAVLVKWPAAPSVLAANPKAIADLAAAMVRVMAAAQAELAQIRRRRR
jgi:hypothetical protein